LQGQRLMMIMMSFIDAGLLEISVCVLVPIINMSKHPFLISTFIYLLIFAAPDAAQSGDYAESYTLVQLNGLAAFSKETINLLPLISGRYISLNRNGYGST